ncbi:MAG: TIGR03620 family F420-dependent LLM class oxidoreductase [Porticoccaceae bacterium]
MDTQKIGKLGVWANIYTDSHPEQIRLAQQIERWGYSTLWVPDPLQQDPFVSLSVIAPETDKLFLATGIANVMTRAPVAMAATRASLGALSNGRLILGLGVSHPEVISGMLGMDYRKPVTTMRNYLAAMQPVSVRDKPADSPREKHGIVVLAALGDNMLALSANEADGAHPYLTTPEHTARARNIMGPTSFLAPEQKVLLVKDASTARAAARKHIAIYLGLQNYRNNLKTLGFTDNDFQHSGSDRLIDALVAWGDESAIRNRIEAHWEAGASHVCIQPLRPDGEFGYDRRALEAFAPG